VELVVAVPAKLLLSSTKFHFARMMCEGARDFRFSTPQYKPSPPPSTWTARFSRRDRSPHPGKRERSTRMALCPVLDELFTCNWDYDHADEGRPFCSHDGPRGQSPWHCELHVLLGVMMCENCSHTTTSPGDAEFRRMVRAVCMIRCVVHVLMYITNGTKRAIARETRPFIWRIDRCSAGTE
jgi:hypothetical protein